MAKRVIAEADGAENGCEGEAAKKLVRTTPLHEPKPSGSSSVTSRRLLGNKFGAVVQDVGLEDLANPAVCRQLVSLWQDAGGLLILRGLSGLSPQQLCDFSSWFGRLHKGMEVSSDYYITGYPIMQIAGQARLMLELE